MAKTPDYQTSKAEWDGKLPFVYQMGSVTSANATTEGARFVAPCDCEIVEIGFRTITTATNAAAKINAGIVGSLTRNLNAFAITNVTGFNTIPLASLASANFSKGEAMAMSITNADTTGVHVAYMVLMPR